LPAVTATTAERGAWSRAPGQTTQLTISAIAIFLISDRRLRVADLALEFALGLIDLACRLRRMISGHLANVLLDDALRLVQRAFRAILSHCSHLSLQRLVELLDAGPTRGVWHPRTGCSPLCQFIACRTSGVGAAMRYDFISPRRSMTETCRPKRRSSGRSSRAWPGRSTSTRSHAARTCSIGPD